MLNAEVLMFRWISRHPVVVEGWNYHHSMQLGETVLMSCVASFCERWMLRYMAKRIFFLIFSFDMSKLFRHFDKSGAQRRNVKIVSTISTCRNYWVSAGNFSIYWKTVYFILCILKYSIWLFIGIICWSINTFYINLIFFNHFYINLKKLFNVKIFI